MERALRSYIRRFVKARGRKARYLRAWLAHGHHARAMETAGISSACPILWERRDPVFAEARALVERAIAERHEATLDAIAAGEPGTELQLKAISLRLRALRPARYRDSAQRVELTGAGGGPLAVEDGSASRAVELLARFAAAQSRPALPDQSAAQPEGGA